MTDTRSPEIDETPLSRDILYALRNYLGGRRGLAALAAIALVAGLALNWSWLVTAGMAPLLLTVLPCLVMCAFGLCMNRMAGRSCSTETAAAKAPETTAVELTTPVSLAERQQHPNAKRPFQRRFRPLRSNPNLHPAKGVRTMPKSTKVFAAGAAIIAALTVATAIYAQESGSAGERRPMMENGMMGQGGMMNMMQQMSRMMESCNTMMQSMMQDRASRAPDDRGQATPPAPDSNR